MASSSCSPDVLIVGAGPSGCLLALLLSSTTPSLSIQIRDLRPSPLLPTTNPNPSKSINLALSTRGLTALSLANLTPKISPITVPMHGRCIHPMQGPLQTQRYGLDGQFLLSVSREKLTTLLVEECQNNPAINIEFGMRCIALDAELGIADFENVESGVLEQLSAALIVGADGAYSKVRQAMMRRANVNYSQTYVTAAYKEVGIELADDQSKNSRFEKEWLHVWPRDNHMLIALPNENGQFTCTLFMDRNEMTALNTAEEITQFFKAHFPDAQRVMPHLVEDFQNAPVGSMLTVRCQPYNYKDKVVIVGDAAHAIVPFYGQGCNAAFEDCRLLSEKIHKFGWEHLEQALSSYSQTRKRDADAIADLAIDHYTDMSSRSTKPFFVLRRRLEIMLNRFFPHSFLPLYTMISFSNIPYADAVERAMEQDRAITSFLTMLGVTTISVTALAAGRTMWNRFITAAQRV